MMLRLRRAAPFVVLVGASQSCLTSIDDVDKKPRTDAAVDVSTGGTGTITDAGSDASSDTSPSVDGAPDDAPLEAGPMSVVIANAGTIPNSTGYSQQTHLVYSTVTGLWWMFYLSSLDATFLKVRTSPDFVTWTDSPPYTLPLPHGGEARQFSIALKTIAGVDVIHLTFSAKSADGTREHYHLRAMLSDSAALFSPPTLLSKRSISVIDGNATAIANDGQVVDLTIINAADAGNIGDSYAFMSVAKDIGNEWVGQFGAIMTLSSSNYVNTRAAVPFGPTSILALWEDGADPGPTSLGYRVWNGSTWAFEKPVFGTAAAYDDNDWVTCKRADDDIHIFRRRASGEIDHRRFDGVSINTGATVPADSQPTGSGLFCAAGATSVSLYAIGAAPNAPIRVSTWNGTAWTDWSTLESASAQRTAIAGYSSRADGKHAVIWTQTTEQGGFEIAGRPLEIP